MKNEKGISKIGLVSLVVSSSIGSGVFAITKDLASASSPGPALLAWLIVGIGIVMLVLSLNNLGEKRSDLDAGIFGYAEEMGGKLAGFISGWGYWMSSWLGNVAFATMFMAALGDFFPIFSGGQNLPSVICASIFIWGLTFLVNNGIESASIINGIVMICKLVPLFLFLIFCLLSFKAGLFTTDFWGNVAENLKGTTGDGTSIWLQMKGCLMVMMWVFVGIEGASVLSSRAKKRSEAQQATIIGVSLLLFIYILASLLPYGVCTRQELINLPQPAMAHIMTILVGNEIGASFINLALIISVIGAWLSWTMLPAETTQLMARDGLLPKLFGELNKKNSPSKSLFITAGLTNLFLLTFLVTDYAYKFAYSLCTASVLICYLFVAIYQMKYSKQHGEKGQFVIGVLATAFQLIGISLAGIGYVLMTTVAYLPGLFFYYKASKQNGREITRVQKWVMALIAVLAFLSLILLVSGTITV